MSTTIDVGAFVVGTFPDEEADPSLPEVLVARTPKTCAPEVFAAKTRKTRITQSRPKIHPRSLPVKGRCPKPSRELQGVNRKTDWAYEEE
jgi:hypothetical protein